MIDEKSLFIHFTDRALKVREEAEYVRLDIITLQTKLMALEGVARSYDRLALFCEGIGND